MKRTTIYTTLAQALKGVEDYGKAYATITGSGLVASDNEIDRRHIARLFNEYRKGGLLKKNAPYFTDKYPYIYYMAIREKGQEGSEYTEVIQERLRSLGAAVAYMTLIYNGTTYAVQYETA